MKPSRKNQAEGNLHEIKGEGAVEKTLGKVQKKVGRIGKVLAQ